MTRVWTESDDRVFREAAGDAPDGPTAAALQRSRVDLLALIHEGLPRREYVPGSADLVPAGKRILIPAERKTGKSLAIGVVLAVDVVAAGGTVVIADRENGGDEYARRLADVLATRSAPELASALRERYHYHAWPDLAPGDPDYAAAFAGADLVIFDSARKFLTANGLDENSADDFSGFTEELIDPLMREGIATLILDNAGHENKGRSRGTSAKEDLVDVVYSLRQVAPFDSLRAGRLELACRASRLGEIAGKWSLEIGGGSFGSWSRDPYVTAHTLRPTIVMTNVSRAIEATPGLAKRAIRTAVGGGHGTVDRAIDLLIAEGYVDVRQANRASCHYTIKPYTGAEDDEAP